MIEFEIEVSDQQIATFFTQLRDRLGDMTPVMQDIGELMVDSTKLRFIAGEDPDGKEWAAKSEATIAAYKARGDTPDFRPLFGPSRRLSSEISYRVGPGGQSVEWGSSLIYAAVHQVGAAKGAFGETTRGAKIPWGNIPARPFLGLSSDDEDKLKALLQEWLESAAAAAQGD